MKKFFAALIVVALVLTSLFALTACAKTDAELAIEAAQSMTLEELEAASKKEFEENPDAFFNADSLTSGIKKALQAFAKKYDWLSYDDTNEKDVENPTKGNVTYNSKKGSEYQPKLSAAAKANQYIADFVMIQDANFVAGLAKKGFLISYVPNGEGFEIAESDQQPLVGVTFNKVFMYNNSQVGKDQLQNVWQLTGEDGTTLKGIDKVSFQNPQGEDINKNFLIMLTSEEACEKLAAAYKTYYGKDYEKNSAYKNIGYEFVAKFIANVEYWHSSDSTEVKNINTQTETTDARDGRVIFAGLCKLKDYAGYKVQPGEPGYYKDIVSAAGWNNDVEGFPGFVYNMWTLIPKTAKLPYTACLFVRFLLSNEGYQAGWGKVLGYYSANTLIPSVEGDPALAEWKKMAIVEDVDYVSRNYKSVNKFITQQLAKSGK